MTIGHRVFLIAADNNIRSISQKTFEGFTCVASRHCPRLQGLIFTLRSCSTRLQTGNPSKSLKLIAYAQLLKPMGHLTVAGVTTLFALLLAV